MTAPNIKIRTGAVPVEGGFAVTVNSKPARTPGRRSLVVPSLALAQAIAAEIAEAPGALARRGAKAADTPNVRLAVAAIDGISADADVRRRIVGDLTAYGETDLVCFWAEGPDSLVRRQEAAWRPLLDWFTARFGASLAVTNDLLAPAQDADAFAAIAAEIEAADPFRLAALSLAARAAGSIVIALALAEGEVDAGAAFEAAVVEEAAQVERWGEDAEAARARAARAGDLVDAARFLALLAEGGEAP